MKETELVGLGIKTFRKQLNMTLADIAASTGLSISYLSKIERNQGNVTLDAITKICAAFRIDLVEFLSMDFTKDIIHIQKDKRTVIYYKENVAKYELLTSGHTKQIRGLLVTLYPRKEYNFNKVAMPHTTDELAYVIKGEMLFTVEGKNGESKRYILKEGDSFYLYAGQKHGLACSGNKECISIWTYTAPLCFAENIPSQH